MTTAQEAMDAAQSAQDDANEARREVAGVAGRMGSLETQVATHRQESQDSHRETQRMVGELVSAVAHLKGVDVGRSSLPPAPPDAGPSLTLTPAKVVGVAKWLGGLLAALGIGGGVLHECAPPDAKGAAEQVETEP